MTAHHLLVNFPMSQSYLLLKGRTSLVTLCKHSCPFSVDRFAGTVLKTFSSYPTNRIQYVYLSSNVSDFPSEYRGVRQGYVHGSMHLSVYIRTLSSIIDSYSITHHSFFVYIYFYAVHV